MKRVLLVISMIVLLLGIVGCSAESTTQPEEYVLESSDLIMVNFLPVTDGGMYIFFFEGHLTRFAYPESIQISFDSSLDNPVVRAKGFTKGTGMWTEDRTMMKGVEVIFRDKEQVRFFWIVESGP